MNISIDFKKIKIFFESQTFKTALTAVGIIAIALLIFQIGVFVGYKKASFSFGWSENYNRNFGGPEKMGFMARLPFPQELRDNEFLNPHGIVGTVLKINGNTIIIKGKDNAEKVIIIPEKTSIFDRKEDIEISDLKVDDEITVIGSPNEQGQIEAKLIRIFRVR
jgi:hypothetical protein